MVLMYLMLLPARSSLVSSGSRSCGMLSRPESGQEAASSEQKHSRSQEEREREARVVTRGDTEVTRRLEATATHITTPLMVTHLILDTSYNHDHMELVPDDTAEQSSTLHTLHH